MTKEKAEKEDTEGKNALKQLLNNISDVESTARFISAYYRTGELSVEGVDALNAAVDMYIGIIKEECGEEIFEDDFEHLMVKWLDASCNNSQIPSPQIIVEFVMSQLY
ncbi:hypothetical protein PCE1_003991 [Barthelona sp. PCE]